jgi:archaemetzincin
MEVIVLPKAVMQASSEGHSMKLIYNGVKYPVHFRTDSSKQVMTSDIERGLKSIIKTLKNTSCIVAITTQSIGAEDASLYGEADPDQNIGVIGIGSFCKDTSDQMLRCSAFVVLHEIGHLFGLSHCVYYECVMGGTNGLVEVKQRPFYLCPVCLHKMMYAIGFDAMTRYSELLLFFSRFEGAFTREVHWHQKMLKSLEPKLS